MAGDQAPRPPCLAARDAPAASARAGGQREGPPQRSEPGVYRQRFRAAARGALTQARRTRSVRWRRRPGWRNATSAEGQAACGAAAGAGTSACRQPLASHTIRSPSASTESSCVVGSPSTRGAAPASAGREAPKRPASSAAPAAPANTGAASVRPSAPGTVAAAAPGASWIAGPSPRPRGGRPARGRCRCRRGGRCPGCRGPRPGHRCGCPRRRCDRASRTRPRRR